MRVGLAGVVVAVIVELVTFGDEEGGDDVVSVGRDMGRGKMLMEGVAGGAKCEEGVEGEEGCQMEEELRRK